MGATPIKLLLLAGSLAACSSGPAAEYADAGADRPVPVDAKRVFVSSVLHDGDFGGPSGADALCTTAAAVGGLGGSWRAWLSVQGGERAADRLADVAPWYLVDRETLAFASKAQLLTAPAAAIDLDENSMHVIAQEVWTGTLPGGAPSGEDCGGWRDKTRTATTGQAANPESWTQISSADCAYLNAVYCFEQ